MGSRIIGAMAGAGLLLLAGAALFGFFAPPVSPPAPPTAVALTETAAPISTQVNALPPGVLLRYGASGVAWLAFPAFSWMLEIHKDGEARYTSDGGAEGRAEPAASTFHLSSERLDHLTALFDAAHFFELRDTYDACCHADMSMTSISYARQGYEKQVTLLGGGYHVLTEQSPDADALLTALDQIVREAQQQITPPPAPHAVSPTVPVTIIPATPDIGR